MKTPRREPTISGPCAIPEAVKREHGDLRARVAEAAQAGGLVGEAARRLAKILHPHFIREEEIALRPLGLLKSLAEGNVHPEMAAVLAMTDALKEELPRMLAEHQQIVLALHALLEAARDEKHEACALLAHEVLLHARMEEEVLYPAAILVGEHVKLRLKRT